jgi:5'-nucleotidase
MLSIVSMSAATLVVLSTGCRMQPRQDVASVPPAPQAPAQQPTSMYGDPYAQPAQPGQPIVNDPFAPPPAAPQPVAGPYAPAPGATGSQTYVVQKGDTLWSIATRVYGNGQRWKDIQAANPGLDPTKMKAGQTIVLP